MASGAGSQMVASRRLALVLLYNTNIWYCLLLVASSCYVAWKDILKGTFQCNFSVFLKDCARTQSQTLPSRVGSIWLLRPAGCRASFGPCLRTGVTQGAFLMEMAAQWLVCWKWKKLRRSKSVLGKSAWPKVATRLGMSSPPSELTPRLERGKRKGAGKTQAGHGGSGGIPSLPSILCAWNSSSALPSNMPVLLNQGTPKVIFTQLGKNRVRERYFVLSCPSPTLQAQDAGVWGITDRAGVGLEERSSKIGQNFWGSDDVKLILRLGDRLDLVVRWLHAHHSRQRSLWIHHQQFQH